MYREQQQLSTEIFIPNDKLPGLLSIELVKVLAKPLLPELPAVENGELTGRRTQILRLMLRGFTSKEIAKELTISLKTIDTTLSRTSELISKRAKVWPPSRMSLALFCLSSKYINPAEFNHLVKYYDPELKTRFLENLPTIDQLKEILELLVLGLSHRQIGKKLGITKKAVETRLAKLYKQLELKQGKSEVVIMLTVVCGLVDLKNVAQKIRTTKQNHLYD
jgi:DNA-binding NarL/FixJ family response regulator